MQAPKTVTDSRRKRQLCVVIVAAAAAALTQEILKPSLRKGFKI